MSTTQTNEGSRAYDVVVIGAGYAGLMAALRLGRRKAHLRIALVSLREHFVERVRLQESIVAAVPLRIASISALVAGTNVEFIHGTVVGLDAGERLVHVTGGAGQHREIRFDQAIYALGSGIDVERVKGAAEHAYRLDPGDDPRSAAALRTRLQQSAGRPISVVAVGGAETAIEVAGEIKTAWPNAEVTMVSRSRCGEFKGPRVEEAVRSALARLGVRLIDGEVVNEVRATEILTGSGRTLPYDICVWSAGLCSSPIGRAAGLATDPRGRILVDASLRSISYPHILAVGDAAHPVAPSGAPYRPSAYAAVVSGAHAADVILASKTKRQLPPFSFSTIGQGIAIGRSGAGFFSYPDDRQSLFILEGRGARYARNLAVWFLTYALKLERRFPGFFLWPGRRRVSWQQANEAVSRAETASTGQPA